MSNFMNATALGILGRGKAIINGDYDMKDYLSQSMQAIFETDFGQDAVINQINSWRGHNLNGVEIEQRQNWKNANQEQQNVIIERLFLDWLHYRFRLSIATPRNVAISENVKKKFNNFPELNEIICFLHEGKSLSSGSV